MAFERCSSSLVGFLYLSVWLGHVSLLPSEVSLLPRGLLLAPLGSEAPSKVDFLPETAAISTNFLKTPIYESMGEAVSNTKDERNSFRSNMRRQIRERNFIALGADPVFIRSDELSEDSRQDTASELGRNILLF